MKNCVRLCVALLALFSVTHAQVLPQLAPGDVGLAKDRLDRIKVRMEKDIAENRLSGGIGLIARRGKIAYFETYGMADKEAQADDEGCHLPHLLDDQGGHWCGRDGAV